MLSNSLSSLSTRSLPLKLPTPLSTHDRGRPSLQPRRFERPLPPRRRPVDDFRVAALAGRPGGVPGILQPLAFAMFLLAAVFGAAHSILHSASARRALWAASSGLGAGPRARGGGPLSKPARIAARSSNSSSTTAAAD